MCFLLFTGAAEATFNDNSSVIVYSNTFFNTSQDPVVTVSLQIRTRDFSATVLYLRHNVSGWFISVQLSDGKLQVLSDFGALSSLNTDTFVGDGVWHEITITFTHNVTSLIIDGNSTDDKPVAPENQLQNFVNSNCEVFVGSDAELNNHFKGCLGEVRVNSLLLPFFMRSELANDTSAERFDVTRIHNVDIGCHGDDVCGYMHCQNNGTCRDVWNAHVCDCVAGFNGTSCEKNIDECAADNQCENGATCVDGIASYSCICPAGFTGLL